MSQTINGKVDLAQVGGTDVSGADIIDPTQLAVRVVQTAKGTIGTGRQTVTTNGTPVQLSGTSTATRRVFIQSETDNTGNIIVGDSNIESVVGSERGIVLFTSQSIIIEIDNLNKVYIDSTVNGEGVAYLYEV